MNYLAHFQMARRLSTEPEFHLGSLLPDILSAYDRQIRFRRAFPTSRTALAGGIRCHLDADESFHRSAFFKDCNDHILSILLRRMPRTGIRLFFLSHVTVEFLLDHLLMERDPRSGTALYDSLSRCSMTDVGGYLADMFGRTPASITHHLDTFLALRFILTYGTFDGLAHGISAVLRRARQRSLTGELLAVWKDIAHESLSILRGRLNELPV